MQKNLKKLKTLEVEGISLNIANQKPKQNNPFFVGITQEDAATICSAAKAIHHEPFTLKHRINQRALDYLMSRLSGMKMSKK